MTPRPVYSPVPRYARTGYLGRPTALDRGGRRQGEIEQRRKFDSPAPQGAAFYRIPGLAVSRGFSWTKKKNRKNRPKTRRRLSGHYEQPSKTKTQPHNPKKWRTIEER